MIRRSLALLLTLCLLVTSCSEEDPRLERILSELPARAPGIAWIGEANDLSMGEAAIWTFCLRVGDREGVELPDPVARYADVEGLHLEPAAPGVWREVAGGALFTRDYRLLWLRPGERTLPALEFRVGEDELRSAPRDFVVREGLPESAGERPQLDDDWIREPAPRPLWPWGLGAAGALLVLFVLWRVLRRHLEARRARAPRLPPPPPREVALGRLQELEQRLDRGQISGEELVLECSLVIRSWMQHGLRISALERTTEEFLAELGASRRLTGDMQNRLAAFLRESDLVKFAAQHAHVDTCRSLLERAREFVQATDRREDSEPLPGSA